MSSAVPTPTLATEGAQPDGVSGAPEPRRKGWFWRITPLFLSAAFFLSGVFVPLSPLPLLFLGASGKAALWLPVAIATNLAIVLALGNSAITIAYVVLVSAPVLFTPLFLLRSRRTALSLAVAVLMGAAAFSAAAYVGASRAGISVMDWMQGSAQRTVGVWVQNLGPEARESLFGELTETAWIQAFVKELPAHVVFFFITVWLLNLILVMRLAPASIRERGLAIQPELVHHWRARPFWIWPVFAAGFFYALSGSPYAEVWGFSAFRLSMIPFLIQGVCVTSSLLVTWKLPQGLRFVGTVVLVLFASPGIAALGFFDHWFDFRTRFRQS